MIQDDACLDPIRVERLAAAASKARTNKFAPSPSQLWVMLWVSWWVCFCLWHCMQHTHAGLDPWPHEFSLHVPHDARASRAAGVAAARGADASTAHEDQPPAPEPRLCSSSCLRARRSRAQQQRARAAQACRANRARSIYTIQVIARIPVLPVIIFTAVDRRIIPTGELCFYQLITIIVCRAEESGAQEL